MDHNQFDALTRSVMVEAGSRRALVRLLVGTALGAVAARFGLTEEIAAKPKPHHATSKHRDQSLPHPSPKRQAEGHPKPPGGVQTEGKHKKKPKNPKTPKPHKPPTKGFVCPTMSRCQVVQEDTTAGTVDLHACSGDGGAGALCAQAAKTQDFRALTGHLQSSGYALDGAPHPTLELYQVQQDGTDTEDVLVLRFVTGTSGKTALLRYGLDLQGTPTSVYVFLQQEDTLTALLAVEDGTVTTTPITAPASASARRSPAIRPRHQAAVQAASNPDNPYDGQANELCQECSIVCKTLSSLECSLLASLLSGSPVAAVGVGPICNKPAEAGCGPYCHSMVAPLLEDDPQNCGACGRVCPANMVCRQGQCDYPCPANKILDPTSGHCICEIEGWSDCATDHCDCHISEGEVCFTEGPVCCNAGGIYCPQNPGGGCCASYQLCTVDGCCSPNCLCRDDPARCCDHPCLG
jgi:hypothetical protein